MKGLLDLSPDEYSRLEIQTTIPMVAPCIMVIFGGSGNLTYRLLIPALYNLSCAGLLDEKFAVIAVDWADHSTESLQEEFTHFIEEFVHHRGDNAVLLNKEKWDWLCKRITYLRGSFTEASTYRELGKAVGNRSCVFYLAVAARFFSEIVRQLGVASLTTEENSYFRRVIIEKPFGSDLISAMALNHELQKHLQEPQIYRIDHYLGKETVQNILAFRFSNGFFEPLWNRNNIDHIQITVAETVGVEQRGAFYEMTGALRDMVPNHVMQLFCMIGMEAPVSFDADAVRDEKTRFLSAVHIVDVADVVRGQYLAGSVGKKEVLAYRQEPNVNPESRIETYIAMKVMVDNWRWAGVPFYIRTGKRLHLRNTHIAVHFKSAPYSLFRDTPVDQLIPNIMVLSIQPSEGITLQFSVKRPGPFVRLGGVQMKFDYADWFTKLPNTGYETLIYDCMMGDATLFQRSDNIEGGWRVVDPILKASEANELSLFYYPSGSQGPDAAKRLLRRDGRQWLQLRD